MRIQATLLTMIAASALFAQQDLLRQSDAEVRRKSEGCLSAKCHVNTEPMHASPAVRLGSP